MTTYSALSIKRLAPRHLEIMRRLLSGQKNVEICQSMGLSQSRLSIIRHAPLFQLVMRQEMIKQAERVTQIQENLLEGAVLGTQLHNDILKDTPGLTYNDQKVRSATIVTNLALKMIGGSNGNSHSSQEEEVGEGEEENLSYEERLQRVTVTKTERVTFKDRGGDKKGFGDLEAALSQSLPDPSELEEEEERSGII